MKSTIVLAVVIVYVVVGSAFLIFLESKKQTCSSDNPIIRLAYLHHIVYPTILSALLMTLQLRMAGIGLILYSAWTFFGYLLKWKHIYCSYQISAREPMTPFAIWWGDIKTDEVYCTPLIFLICGIGLIVVPFWL